MSMKLLAFLIFIAFELSTLSVASFEVRGSNVDLGVLNPGDCKAFNVSLSWTGTTQLNIESVAISGVEWIKPLQTFPLTVYMPIGQTVGNISIPFEVKVPVDAGLMPYENQLVFKVECEGSVLEVSCGVRFSVANAQVEGSEPSLWLTAFAVTVLLLSTLLLAFRKMRSNRYP